MNWYLLRLLGLYWWKDLLTLVLAKGKGPGDVEVFGFGNFVVYLDGEQ